MNYRQDLKDRRWQRKRLEILDRDNWMCKLCGSQEDTVPLHVHHFKYTGRAWEADDDDLITVCETCHTQIHSSGFDAWLNRKFKILILQLLFQERPWVIHQHNSNMYFTGRNDLIIPIKYKS